MNLPSFQSAKNKTVISELDVDGLVVHTKTKIRTITESVAHITVEVSAPDLPDFHRTMDVMYTNAKVWKIPYVNVDLRSQHMERTFIGPWAAVRANLWISQVSEA